MINITKLLTKKWKNIIEKIVNYDFRKIKKLIKEKIKEQVKE